MAITGAALAIMVIAEQIDHRIPGALIGLVLATAAVTTFGLERHGVALVGSIHAGLPYLGVPSVHFRHVRRLLGPALTVAFVCVVQTAATERSARLESQSPRQFDRDLVAVGPGAFSPGSADHSR